jgi:hypothetical protein
LVLTQTLTQWVPEFFPGGKVAKVWCWFLLPPYACMAWTGDNLTLFSICEQLQEKH